jgi:prephenate dehydrogenase
VTEPSRQPAATEASIADPAFDSGALGRSVVAIVGLGLMGGSLALALKDADAVEKIIGIDRNQATLDAALARGAVDVSCDGLEMAREANMVILATPVRTVLRQLARLGEIAADGALLLDLGSTKRRIVSAMDQLPTRLFAVGGHPMCGKETGGFKAAEASLYRDTLFILTPTARSSEASLATATELARAAGARVLVMEAERHDRIVAAMSHLPFVIASNLIGTVDGWAQGEDEVWNLAASGFRDTTRLAASDAEMMLDILLTNSENVADLMRRFSRHFARLADLIYDEDEEALRAALEAAATKRQELGNQGRKSRTN